MNINDVALRRLGTRNRTIFELTKYLEEKEFPKEEVKLLIDDFIQYDYLNDFRYCQEYFRYSFGKGKGKRKVFLELTQRGVSMETIENAFDEYEDGYDEGALARREARKILALADLSEEGAVPEKILGRIGRRLASKGYSAGIIYEVIGELRG